MIAFAFLCVVALALLVGASIAVYFCYHAQSGDGQFGFGLLAVILLGGFTACAINAVIRADALDKEPGIHIELKR